MQADAPQQAVDKLDGFGFGRYLEVEGSVDVFKPPSGSLKQPPDLFPVLEILFLWVFERECFQQA
ncbi:hypothetical protein IQ238_27590 [Pleurocapsales cyanobacterium LEGE 06147]|nr:hypothetical protein [Pleurocapsales cyanobacterium LEGE 06147]